MSFNFEESEQEQKIQEIERTLEYVVSQIEDGSINESDGETIMVSGMDTEGRRQVILHWVKWGQVESYDSCEEILTIEDAKIAVREAAEFRDKLNTEDATDPDKDVEVCRPVHQGDILVLPCSPCTYIAYATWVDMDKGPNYAGYQSKDYSGTAETQYVGGQDEADRGDDAYRQDLNEYVVRREFLIWNVSSVVSEVDIPIGTVNSTEGPTTSTALATLDVTELATVTEEFNVASLAVTQTVGNLVNLEALTDIEDEDVDPCEDEPDEYDANTTYAIGDIVYVLVNGVKEYFKVVHLNANLPLNPLTHNLGIGIAEWQTNVVYAIGDVRKITLDAVEAAAMGIATGPGEYFFECTTAHTSPTNFTDEPAKWQQLTEEEAHPWKPIEDWCLEQRIDDGIAQTLDISALEVEDIDSGTTGPYAVGVYEPQAEGTPVQFDALTSIETLNFTAGSSSNSGNLDSIQVTTADTGVTGVVFKDAPSYNCSASDDEYPCLDSGAAVNEDDEFYDPATQKHYRAKANDSGGFPVSDSTKWEEINPTTTPSNCLVLAVHDYTEKQVTVNKTTLPYAYGSTTISGTAKSRPITITPQEYKLEQKNLTFSIDRKYLNTSNAKVVLSNHLKNLTFKRKPFTLTPSLAQFTQQIEKLRLTSEKLRFESVKETGDLLDFTVSIFSGNQTLTSTPCGALAVSIGASIGSSLGTARTFTIKGFEPDGSTVSISKDLFSPVVSLFAVGGPSIYNIGGTALTVGAEQDTVVNLSIANISVGVVTPDQQILLSNMFMAESDPCVDPDSWDTNLLYDAGDYVMHGGSYWKALQTSQAITPSAAVPTYWEEFTQEEYCDEIKPVIANSKIVVDPEATVSLSGTGPSTFQLTGTPQPDGSENFKSLDISATPRNANAYIPMLYQCPVDNVTVEAFSGANPVSIAGSTRVSISASGSCDLVIQNQLKFKTKSYDVKCGVLAHTDDVCPEETVVTNDMVVDAFTTQGYTEQSLDMVYQSSVEVCIGSSSVSLNLLHVDPAEGVTATCAGWFIPCEVDSYGDPITQAPKVLKKDDTGELSLLSLDCS